MSTEYRLDDAIEFHANITLVGIRYKQYLNRFSDRNLPDMVIDMFEYFDAKPSVGELNGDPHVAQMFKNNIPVMHAKMGVLMTFMRENLEVHSPHIEFCNYMFRAVEDAVMNMDRIQANVMHRSDFESIARMK